ncbi:nuclear transport factor 2 family protein [Devosia sp.]|uniref:nuclear transport factor 2 family protein n=1 Tax=Devosia sp. TaxID=1871048 RepID=UPI001B18BFCA|nr:nuclear transport factor 2 family protein [Devosia sp.]MBO9587362.1 nuclear transport factor 2 family protein [Devosia sp.]
MSENIELVKRYVAAVERFDLDEVEQLIDPEMTFQELPNRIRPAGGRDDHAAILAGLRRAGERKVLSSQRYVLGDIIEAGDRVVVEGRWEGTMAVPLGRLQVGDKMIAHLCMIFGIRDGKIAWQRNYDCYEDFSAK